jgi:hypothetical protein
VPGDPAGVGAPTTAQQHLEYLVQSPDAAWQRHKGRPVALLPPDARIHKGMLRRARQARESWAAGPGLAAATQQALGALGSRRRRGARVAAAGAAGHLARREELGREVGALGQVGVVPGALPLRRRRAGCSWWARAPWRPARVQLELGRARPGRAGGGRGRGRRAGRTAPTHLPPSRTILKPAAGTPACWAPWHTASIRPGPMPDHAGVLSSRPSCLARSRVCTKCGCSGWILQAGGGGGRGEPLARRARRPAAACVVPAHLDDPK